MRRVMAVVFALVPLVAVLGLSVGPAAAASFTFSYVFDVGNTLDGMLDGDISLSDPNLVENVVVTTVVIDGGVVAPFTPTSTLPDHNTVSFDGSQMDLQVEGIFQGLFALVQLDSTAAISSPFGILFDPVFEPSRWELTPIPVPEPGTAMLLGLGGLIVALRTGRPQR